MEPTDRPPPMLAKEREDGFTARLPQADDAATSNAGRQEKPRLTADTESDRLEEQVLTLLGKGLFLRARDLAKEAAARFPEHARLQKLWWFFDNRGKSRPSSLPPGPNREEEFEWLRHPPGWARGKWVALVGSEAIAVGDTLKEVAESARSRRPSRRPLVHRID